MVMNDALVLVVSGAAVIQVCICRVHIPEWVI